MTRAERAVGVSLVGLLVVGGLTTTMRSTPVVSLAPAARTQAPSVTPRSKAPAVNPPARRVPTPSRQLATGPIGVAPPVTGCPPPPLPPNGHGPTPLGKPAVAEAALPKAVAVHGKARDLNPVRGKGLWVTPWASTKVDASALVARARRTGVQSLWIRTGGSRQGYYGDQFLGQLVPAAHTAGVAVIAWDFPAMSDPMSDARRAQRALQAGVDAFSPDVETAAEGTFVTSRRLALYLSLVRRYAGSRPVIATVPRPSSQRSTFPYQAFVPYADVFAPMVYWSCREPGALVQQSLARLGTMLPVAPIGQAYDMGPEGGRLGTPSRLETLRFLDSARRAGCLGASLWTVETAGRAQLQALADYVWPLHHSS